MTSIKFLNASEAAVAYEVVSPDGQVILSRYDGRVLCLHSAWRIERNAFTSLLELAGVHCPPAPEPGPNTSS